MYKIGRRQELTSFSYGRCNPSGNKIARVKKEKKLNNLIIIMTGKDSELSDGSCKGPQSTENQNGKQRRQEKVIFGRPMARNMRDTCVSSYLVESVWNKNENPT